MKCPACGRDLMGMKAGDIMVDVCKGGCGGIWFDSAELQKVDEGHESAGEALLYVPRDENVRVDAAHKRLCPKCSGVVMMKHFANVKRNVEVDECALCGGVWLDSGELGRIRSEFTTEAEREKAAAAYFSDIFDMELKKVGDKSADDFQKARRFAHMFRLICPSYYIPGKQKGGAF